MLFRNRLEIWNPGVLPFRLTIAKLYEDHKSIPANPLLAESMYYKGCIEKAGTGTGDIVEKCRAYGLPMPQYQQDEDFRVVLYRPEIEENVPDHIKWTQSGTQSEQAIIILEFCREPKRVGEIREKLGYTNRTKFRQRYMLPLLSEGLLEMTIPEKPTSSQQKYKTTVKGLLVGFFEKLMKRF